MHPDTSVQPQFPSDDSGVYIKRHSYLNSARSTSPPARLEVRLHSLWEIGNDTELGIRQSISAERRGARTFRDDKSVDRRDDWLTLPCRWRHKPRRSMLLDFSALPVRPALHHNRVQALPAGRCETAAYLRPRQTFEVFAQSAWRITRRAAYPALLLSCVSEAVLDVCS